MAKIVQAWAVTGAGSANANPARQLVEGSMDITDVQVMSTTCNEEEPRWVAVRNAAIPTGSIMGKHFLSRSMDRYQARFTEFGAADRQQAVLEIDIVELQANRLTDPQTRHAQQSQQAVVGPRTQTIKRRKFERATQQVSNFLLRIQIWSRSLRPKRQQSHRWNLGLWITRHVVARKATDIAQTLCPCRRLGQVALLYPFQSDSSRDVSGASGLQKRGKLRQANTRIPELEPQAAPQGQVVLD